jgi:DNA primase
MFGLSNAEKVKRDHQIEDVIRSYGVELKKNGKSLKGLCPFHPDRNPSLSVTPDTGLWHCFGCDVGGTVIDWVAKIENLSDRKAIEQLAKGNGASEKWLVVRR